jgi:hypothetical protein
LIKQRLSPRKRDSYSSIFWVEIQAYLFPGKFLEQLGTFSTYVFVVFEKKGVNKISKK